jgi:hypothetical protein
MDERRRHCLANNGAVQTTTVAVVQILQDRGLMSALAETPTPVHRYLLHTAAAAASWTYRDSFSPQSSGLSSGKTALMILQTCQLD